MYKFEDIQLRRIDEKYIVTAKGKDYDSDKYSDSQLRNPRLAIRRFIDAIYDELRDRVVAYLSENNYNEVMGCSVDMHCPDCKAYHLNDELSNCPFIGKEKE